jgi:hypothetical protein
MAMDIDALFRLAEEAKRQATLDEGEDGIDDMDEDGDDYKTMYANAGGRLRTGKPTFTDMPGGDVHVCYGAQCPHVEVTKEKQLVCSLTGRVVGVEHSREQEAGWTGRSVGSANPDDTAGTPIGGWIKRRDMFAASSQAWQMAKSFGEADQKTVQTYVPPPTRPAKTTQERLPAKRGALCVDDGESPASPSANRRQRTGRRETWTHDAIEKLVIVAATVVSDLFIVGDDQTSTTSVSTSTPTDEERDPRLQNIEFVRTLALRRYVNACAKGEQRLNASVLNDVCIHANAFVRAKRAEANSAAYVTTETGNKGKRRGACYQGPVRHLIARLIVTLWHAACLTPHMRDNRKGNDSFQPFAAGVIYSLKRGVYLENGTCVVPELETLAGHLPALRSTHSTPTAKRLQSSSHRGICSLHRSMTSISSMEAEEAAQVSRLLADAARQAALLREMTHRIDGAK